MTPAVGDRWAAGAAYERYMGRWSRALAQRFLEWLQPARQGHWLEIGCGTGSLTATICELCEPSSLLACEPSAPFLEHARSMVADPRVSFVHAAADTLPSSDRGFDAIVSGLVLNFIPQPEQALIAMRERARPGATVAAYLWDYVGGLEFLQCFWEEAVILDPRAAELDEARRFGRWQASLLDSLFRGAGLERVETSPIEIVTRFADFEDYWQPFLGGTGPAPSYVTSLDATGRKRLRDRLENRLSARADEPIELRARASAVLGVVT